MILHMIPITNVNNYCILSNRNMTDINDYKLDKYKYYIN
jgi:hypothetical protein